MTDIDKINAVLKELGSDMIVHYGDTTTPSIAEILYRLPAYVDRKVDEAIDAYRHGGHRT